MYCRMNRVECRYANMNGWCDSSACHNMNLLANCHNLEDDTIPTQENKPQSNWHTGTPTETGEYLVCRIPEAGYLFRYNQLCVFSDLMGILDHKIFYIGEVGKNSFENITDSVIAWQKIEPYEASKETD